MFSFSKWVLEWASIFKMWKVLCVFFFPFYEKHNCKKNSSHSLQIALLMRMLTNNEIYVKLLNWFKLIRIHNSSNPVGPIMIWQQQLTRRVIMRLPSWPWQSLKSSNPFLFEFLSNKNTAWNNPNFIYIFSISHNYKHESYSCGSKNFIFESDFLFIIS